MLEVNLKRCSRCHKEFTDIIAAVKLDIEVFRLNAMEIPEQIANLDQESHEYLCKECFDDFALVLEKMNLNSSERKHLENERQEQHMGLVEDREPQDCVVDSNNQRDDQPQTKEILNKFIDDVEYD